jgi:hypothetical protein
MVIDKKQFRTRVFIWEFVWTAELIKDIFALCDQKEIEICGWAVREKDIQTLLKVNQNAPVFEAPLPSNLKLINYDFNLIDGFHFAEEENISFLLDREGKYQNNMHSSQVRFQVHSWVETLLDTTKPDWILFPDVPHNIFTYLLYLSAKRKGIKTLMLRMGLAPHLFTISESVERNYLPDLSKSENVSLSSQSSEFLNTLKLNEVEPNYMTKQRKDSQMKQIFLRALSKGINLFSKKSLGATSTYVKRWQLKKYYESICISNLNMDKPYIVVFLHLQPERSSMPEGGIFAQQWLMLQMLSNVCKSEDWNLYIKEHPSIFMAGPKLYRGKWFYDSVKELPKVSFISSSVNSKLIIKKSRAVATITGSPGLEAVANGIPALFFGESGILGCTGTFRIQSQEDLNVAIKTILNGIEIKFDDFERFYSAWENEVTCYNSGLSNTADFNSLWSKGIPQKEIFIKMVQWMENEKSVSLIKDD